MGVATEILIIVALVVANGVFAGAEIAILSVRKTRLRELADEGSGAAKALVAMRERPESFLATVQIGITVVGATAAAFGGATIARVLASALARLGLGARSDDVALALVVAFVSFLSLVLGELVPKSLALRTAERYALLVARPLAGLAWLGRPVVWALTLSSNFVLRWFGDKTTFTEARLSREELQQLVDEASTAGTVDARAGEIAFRALEFGDVRVGAVMVPRPDMITLPLDATTQGIRDVLLERWHTRLPVHDAASDDIVGYVTSRDLVRALVGERSVVVREVMHAPVFVPESRLAAEVLREMQRTRVHLAVVVDERGETAGLVTLEDLLEELVGEIFSEHETVMERIRRERDGVAVVRGRVPVHEVNRELGLELPEGPSWTTIGGLVTSLAGAIPPRGATVKASGVTLEAVEVTDRRVLAVRVTAERPSRPAG